MNSILLYLVPAFSAGLLVLAFPPFNAGYLAWVGLAPLLFALRQGSVPAAGVLALLFSGIYCLGGYRWGMQIASFNILVFLLMAVVFSVYALVFGVAYRLLFTPLGAWRILAVPSLWVVLEYVRANLGFLAFPWNLLGHAQYRYPLVIQMADVTGVYGISFLLLMVNQWLSELPDLCVRA